MNIGGWGLKVLSASEEQQEEKYCLLGCNTVQFGRSPKFRRNITLPSSKAEE
jgi:hypothetical protein